MNLARNSLTPQNSESGFGNRWTLILLFIILLPVIPVSQLVIFAITPLNAHFEGLKVIEVSKGETPNDITKKLLAENVIQDGKSFIWVGRLLRQWSKIKAGEYAVSPALTPRQIFGKLTSGISIPHPVTVREGENMYEIAQDLASKKLANPDKFIHLCQDQEFIRTLSLFKGQIPPSLEGFLYPDTYHFNRGLTEADMVRQMVRHFFDFWTSELEVRALSLKMDLHQVVTLASIIEKETGAPEERPLISSVFHNRLNLKMKLQSDPTTIYGIWNRYHGSLHKEDLFVKNPYNTYMIPGLPIGPISNPGKESIVAALFPEKTAYLFFVSHNDGTHEFSRTLQEHNHAVDRFQKDPKAREGKSWRDRLKK